MTGQFGTPEGPRRRGRVARAVGRATAIAFLLLPAYAVLAYVVLPATWLGYRRTVSAPDELKITYTRERLPGDPLNVALVGTRDEVVAAMRRAGWAEADPITFRSGLRDAGCVLFDRPYATAPVSTHYLWNRRQDLAFERVVGRSPRRRHHVRFWRAPSADAGDREPGSEPGGRELWLGAATFDRGMGLSRFTGELMHHIDGHVDAEREALFADLRKTGCLRRFEVVSGFRPAGLGRNGGGDLYETDGKLFLGELEGAEAAPVPDGRSASAR